MSELARVGVACAAPAELDDVHLVLDKVAVVQPPGDVGDGSARPLLLTTLLPSSPKLMLNVESDDVGTLTRRSCGCDIGSAGLEVHLHGIRSAEKLTTEGMSFLQSELVVLVEHELPARFGGGPTDYQLVEEEAADGVPRVCLVVSPRIGVLDEGAVVTAALEALARGGAAQAMMADVWRSGSTLRVVRREPHQTASAKILPLHVSRAP
jgi:hypothetical protein